MKRVIVADSSSNVRTLPGVAYAFAPLTVRVDGVDYVDNESLDKQAFLDALEKTKDASTTSCPNIQDWLHAFGDADEVFAVALTSGLSGGYNAAINAAEHYRESNPGAKVFVLDSKSTGPELELIIEKYAQLIEENLSFEHIVSAIQEYWKRTHLMFALREVDNFAKNGRVNPLVAKLASALNIRIVGQASDQGELQVLHKSRGEKNALNQILANMVECGFAGGRTILRHTQNLAAAQKLEALIKERFPECHITIGENEGLCSYYAEPGGLLVGFEAGA